MSLVEVRNARPARETASILSGAGRAGAGSGGIWEERKGADDSLTDRGGEEDEGKGGRMDESKLEADNAGSILVNFGGTVRGKRLVWKPRFWTVIFDFALTTPSCHLVSTSLQPSPIAST